MPNYKVVIYTGSLRTETAYTKITYDDVAKAIQSLEESKALKLYKEWNFSDDLYANVCFNKLRKKECINNCEYDLFPEWKAHQNGTGTFLVSLVRIFECTASGTEVLDEYYGIEEDQIFTADGEEIAHFTAEEINELAYNLDWGDPTIDPEDIKEGLRSLDAPIMDEESIEAVYDKMVEIWKENN